MTLAVSRPCSSTIRGGAVKRTPLTEDFPLAKFVERYGEAAIPLFRITASGKLHVVHAGEPLTAEAGDSLISLVEEIAFARFDVRVAR